MTVAQVNRSTNSVTVNVSGITEGDRQTYVWITNTILDSTDGVWYSLQKAKNYGYISDFEVTDINANNGDITIYIPDKYAKEYKVWDIKVENINTSDGDFWIVLNTVLGFEYDNSFPKYAGDTIDITVNDMQQINLFGGYIDSWINSGDGIYYPLDDVFEGDSVFAEYFVTPSQNIWNTAYNNRDLLGGYYNVVWNYTSDIVDNCVSGADFKALWFNGILYAINNFNMSYTYP